MAAARVMELLKELETVPKEKENDPNSDVKPSDTKDIGDNVEKHTYRGVSNNDYERHDC